MQRRSRTRALAAVGTAATVLALAACSSGVTNGAGSTGTVAAAGGSHSASPSGGSGSVGKPQAGTSDASALAYQLHRAVAAITSDHIVFSFTTAGQTISGSGDQKLSGGATVAYKLSESLPTGGSLSLITVGGQSYAMVPAAENTTGKPWLLVSATSSNPTARTLAASLQSTQTSQSLETTGVFVTAAQSVTDDGAATVDGVATTHYALVIDPQKLPTTFAQRSALIASGITSIPLDLYVDSQTRPIRIVENLTVQGSAVSTTSTISDFDAPVTITAPPASQVAH